MLHMNSVEYQDLEMKECYMDSFDIMTVSSRQCTKHNILEVVKKSALLSSPAHLCKESGCTVLKELFKETL